MSKGFLIIATKQRKYGEAAFNLVVSLKLSFPEVPVAVITDGQIQKLLHYEYYVDQVIGAPDHGSGYGLKTSLYELTPFKETMYIDADSLLVNDRDFERLWCKEGEKIKIPSSGKTTGEGAWIDLKKAYEMHGISGNYPLLNTSVITWKQSRDAKAFFKAAKYFYENPSPMAKGVVLPAYPDEAAFGLSAVKTGTPCTYDRSPVYWFAGRMLPVGMIQNGYNFITMAGPKHPQGLRNLYNGTARKNAEQMGVKAHEFRK